MRERFRYATDIEIQLDRPVYPGGKPVDHAFYDIQKEELLIFDTPDDLLDWLNDDYQQAIKKKDRMKTYSVTIPFISFEDALPPNDCYILIQHKNGKVLSAYHEKGNFWDSASSSAIGVADIHELKGWSIQK